MNASFNLGKIDHIEARIDALNKKHGHNMCALRQENEKVYIFEVDTGEALECALILNIEGSLYPVSSEAHMLIASVLHS